MFRFIQPERLLRVESLPDIADFFATLQSPITPLLPSFWAGESLFAGLHGGVDLLHASALWTTAFAFTVMLGAAHDSLAVHRLQPLAGGGQGACDRTEDRRRRGRAAPDVGHPRGICWSRTSRCSCAT